MAGRDNAGGDRAAKSEGIADGEHPIAHPRLLAVAEFYGFERLVRLDLEHGDIDFFVLADHFRLQFLSIRENHRHFIGIGDHMIVGDDDAGGIDDEARAERIRLAFARLFGSVAAPWPRWPC